MKMTILFVVLISTHLYALETDNYLVWDKTLTTAEKEVNDFLSDEIKTSLSTSNAQGKIKSCSDITYTVSKAFRSNLIYDNPIENWLMQKLSQEQMYPMTIDYVSQSIYRNPFRFYLPRIGLAPNILIKGVYMGTDKLSHFASTGYHYFLIYNTLKNKMTESEAEEKAILYGATDEKMVHGYWSSGVFSYADLEANYQGLKFYKKMCQDVDPYLQEVDGKWTLVKAPKISDYVSPLWDESFYPSYYLPKNWEKISPVLKEQYCSKARTMRVIGRMAKYAVQLRPSASSIFLKKLEITKVTPSPQSFAKLCLEN